LLNCFNSDNANVKQLKDMPGSEYFKFLQKKAQEGAVNQAKVDVAKARMLGSVGEKEREGESRMKTSKIEAIHR
jgi:flotillin